ncbi:eIF-2B GDP-GTP exchange factor subunit alpha [Hyphodiscus hymeniophilus]|uniref:EIF-2B GDP-GTP exchange factor subunit alpha n=1 Tax=Hyphodiscus hymeniophilus TaxID=353542 RepID=A0A9P6VNS2_9HELO|nr:eIF-2B GDP-GTP exchange factor subunit alpha [Hyphodiscus hymeniophilus]
MASDLRQRAIVSSFICTSSLSPTGFTFALFKRSQDVSTYRGKWAVCSGSIDPTDTSPEFAAKREISEETTLDGNDITLLRRGKPFSLVDEKLKTEWTIHPFAWQLKPNAKPIMFDWEHTEHQFVKPDELENYDHVPQLEIGMKRVLVSEETEKGLAILRDDHESGAQALAVKALEILRSFVNGDEMSKIADPESYWRELRWRAWHLAKNGRPSMGAAIQSVIFKALAAADSNWSQNGSSTFHTLDTLIMRNIINSAIEATAATRMSSLQNLAQHFVEFIERNHSSEHGNDQSISPTHIVTLSSSGSIMKCLAKLIESSSKQAVAIRLTVLESRPNFEGVSFVNKLLSTIEKDSNVLAKLKIEIVNDASVASVVENADYLLIGGDKVLQDGKVSNKIGSLPAAILAKVLNPKCRVVALFETSKITHTDFDSEHPKTEYNDASEMVNAWPATELSGLEENRSLGFQLEVKNAYFEWVPAQYIDAYISEEGVLGVNEIAKLSAASSDLENKLFGDL